MSETKYIVLREVDFAPGERGWREVLDGAITATSATDAVRRAAASKSPADGTYLAIPERSWKPVKVKAETTTVLKLAPSPSQPT